MKTLLVKTLCSGNQAHTTLSHPQATPGDYRGASLQIRRIIDIPDEVQSSEVVKLFAGTCDVSGIGGPARLEFRFDELGIGKIIR